VAVGKFRRTQVSYGAPTVDVGVAPGMSDDPATTLAGVVRAMRAHAARFGPFPFERLVVAVLPDIHGGIEYPGVILLGTGQTRDATASHEVAHQWFYGLVGDDQARDPWLDESFATYAEALDRGTGPAYQRVVVPAGGRGRVGEPMTFWESRQSIYFRSVYVQGAAALLRARQVAGASAFDDAVRCYVRRNAQRIATPSDLRTSLQQLPAAIRILTAAGALR
jgi:aminopeptidase N